jgi:hypothetical protein
MDSHVSSAVTGHFKGLPDGVAVPTGRQDALNPKPWAVWAGPHSIYVMTWGSGSCPKVPTSVKAAGAHVVVIRTIEHDFFKGDTGCSGDLAVTTSVVRLSSDVHPRAALVVRIDGTTTRLAARAG